jgi:Reverse transcriptase (RNA-dependent DNA polymerase)
MRNYTSRFQLPNGKWAYIQRPEFADAAKTTIRQLKRNWTPPNYFYHLRAGGHVAALRVHLGNEWFGKIDLSRFFHNVSRNRISRCLKKLGFSFHEADEIAVASTVCIDHTNRKFALPFGFVQSPLLASIALDSSALGKRLRDVDNGGLTVAAYVDDFIVSGDSAGAVNEALSELRRAANLSNFPINDAKTQGPITTVLSFNIELTPDEMRISKERYEEMSRSVLANGSGPVSDGILGYIRSVNVEQAAELLINFPKSFPHLKV